jgi:hypothetical protein
MLAPSSRRWDCVSVRSGRLPARTNRQHPRLDPEENEETVAEWDDLVGEAFIYGYPLVADMDEVVRFTQSGMGSVPAAGFNEFSHARSLAGPKDTFVTINNDTLYSIAQFDLSAGPLFLDVPDAAGRYYVLQFIDAGLITSPTSAGGPAVPTPPPIC